MRTSFIFPLLTILTPLALASNLNLGFTPISSLLFPRSVDCAGTDIVCGSTCIPSTYTCCPDKAGGCATHSSVCQIGENGEYGCCPTGDICDGDGGAQYIDTKSGDGSNDGSASGTSSASGAAASATGTQQSTSGGAMIDVSVMNGGLMVAVVVGAAVLL